MNGTCCIRVGWSFGNSVSGCGRRAGECSGIDELRRSRREGERERGEEDEDRADTCFNFFVIFESSNPCKLILYS